MAKALTKAEAAEPMRPKSGARKKIATRSAVKPKPKAKVPGKATCAPGPAGFSRPASSTALDYSDDCEMLEIILPAEFDTVTLE